MSETAERVSQRDGKQSEKLPLVVLKLLFAAILIEMLWVTIKAGRVENVFAVAPRFWAEPWWIATLWDAYCGFITFYVWVFYKEANWLWRIVWLDRKSVV
mgnify:CR=1 FL=1